jgi:Protein of unknown function (DUF3223)
MKISIKIGEKQYSTKKEALLHYKNILNSYEFGDSLNDDDYNDLINLFDYSLSCDENDYLDAETVEELETIEEENEEDLVIDDILIAKVQFGAKCFEIIYSDGTSEYISYIMMINRHNTNLDASFNRACRSSVQKDLIVLKQKYFKEYATKGLVKCQETGELSKWEELSVDHRQPNTFSVIIDRFKEVNHINVNKISFYVNEENMLNFTDKELQEKFRVYHQEKANLRIVRKECNLSRTGMARLKRNNKDLVIE